MTDEITRKFLDELKCPKAASFKLLQCADPTCGAHVVTMDESDTPICEMVVGRDSIPEFAAALLTIYDNPPPPRRS